MTKEKLTSAAVAKLEKTASVFKVQHIYNQSLTSRKYSLLFFKKKMHLSPNQSVSAATPARKASYFRLCS
jgi:hypothetical protein